MKRLILAATFLLSGATSVVAHAQTFDATADFQTISNGSGAWSYGYSPLGGASYSLTLFDRSGWSMSNYQILGTPAVWKNGASAQYGVGPGQIALHPGPIGGGDFAIVRFTASMNATYGVTGQFFAGDSGSMNGSIVLDGNIGKPLQYFASTTDQSIFAPLTLKLNAGETLDFVVGNNGSFNSGNTPLSAVVNIAAVPEPESYAMMLAGLGLIGGIARRRKAKQL